MMILVVLKDGLECEKMGIEESIVHSPLPQPCLVVWIGGSCPGRSSGS